MRIRRRVKVVVLVHGIGPGGAEKIAAESVIGLDGERFERLLCTGRQHDDGAGEASDEMLRRVRAAGVEVLALRRRSRFAVWAWWPLLRLLRRERVDILHGHLFGSNLWACLLGRLSGVPVIVCHEHMWAFDGSRARMWAERWLIARWSSAFVAVSEAGLRSMVELERIPRQDVVLLRNGVERLQPGDAEKVRRELGIAAGQPVVLSTGSLRPEKAYEVLIDAAARLVGSSSRPRILIAGEGPERPRLEALITDLGLSGVVTLLGTRSDIPDLLAAADLAVCCSDFEGGPLSVIEYMGAGLPVVATRVGGLPELVHDAENGVLVPPRDPDDLAEAIAGLLGDAERRRRMGEAGRSLRDREYGSDVFIGRLEALYERLLATT